MSSQNSVPKRTMNRQCFTVKDGKCKLKHSHDYYYQVQMQLLVSERTFCDFVLCAENGPVSIERIYRDNDFIYDILKLLSLFWIRVIAPETFEMRVPRNLYPVILPKVKEVRQEASNDSYTLSGDCLDEINMVGEMEEHSGNQVTICHSQAELEIANFLASSLAGKVNVEPTYGAINDLVMFPWEGRTSDGIWPENTCHVDNWVMIFQAMVRSKKLNLEELDAAAQVIESALHLVNQNRYADA